MDTHTPLVLLPSWSVTGLAFLSPPWVLLLAPFVFPLSLLLLRCDSPGPIDTLRLPASAAPSSTSSSSTAFVVTPSSTTWHRRFLHTGRDVLTQLSRSTDVPCTRAPAEHLCHACQLGHHVRLPFSSVTCGHLLYSACLAINIIWSLLMIFLITLGVSLCAPSLRPSPPSTSSPGCPLSSASPLRPSSVITGVSSTTPPPVPSSSLEVFSCVCLSVYLTPEQQG